MNSQPSLFFTLQTFIITFTLIICRPHRVSNSFYIVFIFHSRVLSIKIFIESNRVTQLCTCHPHLSFLRLSMNYSWEFQQLLCAHWLWQDEEVCSDSYWLGRCLSLWWEAAGRGRCFPLMRRSVTQSIPEKKLLFEVHYLFANASNDSEHKLLNWHQKYSCISKRCAPHQNVPRGNCLQR